MMFAVARARVRARARARCAPRRDGARPNILACLVVDLAMAPSGLHGALLGFGNPLLDISAVVPSSLVEKYELTMGNAILAEKKHEPLYEVVCCAARLGRPSRAAGARARLSGGVHCWRRDAERHPRGAVDAADARRGVLLCAAAGLRSASPSPWRAQGAVGDDAFAANMEQVAGASGLRTSYLRTSKPTGKCAVLVVDGERSLVASLGAAEHYDLAHTEANWAAVEAARVFYISSFFITHSHAVIMRVAQHSAAAQKRFVMNLAAPFIMQVPPFKAALMETMPFIDVLVGNESEAAPFAASEGWPADLSIAEIATRISGLPKASGHCGRTVVVTQGADATVVASAGAARFYPVIPLAKEQLVDTNGAGDAFVGGLLSQLVVGKDWAEACRAGNYAAHTVIQRSGCTYPPVPEFTWA